MGAPLSLLIKALDITVHPGNRKRGGMSLLRGRMLSLACLLTGTACSIFLVIMVLTRELDQRFFPIYIILAQAGLFLILNRFVQKNVWLSAILLVFLSILLGMAIVYQERSVYATGFLWFQVLIMPAFLLCGWRLGSALCVVIMLVALGTFFISKELGPLLPYDGDRMIGFRTMLMNVIVINFLTLGMVAIYFHLLHDGEKNKGEQRNWLQRTARMQELLQMSNHFALKTNGPLDVLGTALHNLEEPLQRHMESRVLLSMLAPLESSVQDLAAVAKSFSLFSRRYLDEGLEQTSYNLVLQHVDTLYNVGAVMRRARLHWEKVNPDILIYTQTAKLVMLIISVLRRAGAEGGTGIQAIPTFCSEGLQVTLQYTLKTGQGHSAVASDVDVVFDPELNEDLIHELCHELGIECSQQREGDRQVYRLKLLQERCQARLA